MSLRLVSTRSNLRRQEESKSMILSVSSQDRTHCLLGHVNLGPNFNLLFYDPGPVTDPL